MENQHIVRASTSQEPIINIGELSVRRWVPSLNRIQFNMLWTIPNYKSLCEGKEVGWYIKSPKYSLGDSYKTEWLIRLYPQGRAKESKGIVSAILCPNKCLMSHLSIEKMFYIETEVRNPVDYPDFTKIYPTHLRWKFNHDHQMQTNELIASDVLLDENRKLLPEGKLIILCKACLIKSRFPCMCEIGVCSLSSDLSELFQDQHLTDFTLKTKDGEIKAHKCILAARSPVFAAMFRNDMSEANSNIVEITDIDLDTLSVTLHYLYSGTLRNIDDRNAIEQYLKAADKYILPDFKLMCEEKLFETLTAKNALRTLHIADLYGCEELKSHVMEFLSVNVADITESD